MKKPTSWTEALQRELVKHSSGFTPEHKTSREIAEEFKAAGLPHGVNYVTRYLTSLVRAGKAEQVHGTVAGANGIKVRCVKYLLLP